MELDFIGYYLLCAIMAADLGFVFSARCPKISLPNGRARIRARGRTVQFRCQRGFTRVGAKMAICLKSRQWSQQTPLCVGQGCPALNVPDTMTVTKMYRGGMAHFTCASGYTRQGPEQIYCDGQAWHTTPPVCQEGISLGCDFESEGLCGWSQVLREDEMDWTRHKGASPTKDTGPKTDHTKGTAEGYYLFIETSAPSKRGHSAQLVSPSYNPSDVVGICMEFFYHMFGAKKDGDVGSLEVFLKPDAVPLERLADDDSVLSLFELDGNQGDEWIRQELEIPSQTQPFQFVFEATKQKSWLSDIAIDDIRLYNCTDNIPSTTTTIATSPSSTSRATVSRSTPQLTTPRQAGTTTMIPGTKSRSTTSMTPKPTTTRLQTTKMRRPSSPQTTARITTARNVPPTTTQRIPTTRQPTATTRMTATTMGPTSTTTTRMSTKQWATTLSKQDTTMKKTKAPIKITTAKVATTRTTTRAPRTTTTTTMPSKTDSKMVESTSTQRITPATYVTSVPPTLVSVFDKSTGTHSSMKSTQLITANEQSSTKSKTQSSSMPPYVAAVDPSQGPLTKPPKTDQSTIQKHTPTETPVFRDTSSTPVARGRATSLFTNVHGNQKPSSATPNVPSSDSTDNSDKQRAVTSTGVGVGKVMESPSSSSSSSSASSQKLLPLIAGVVGAVVLVAIVVAVLAYKWSKKRRMKEEREMEDQMNIITEYVETTIPLKHDSERSYSQGYL